MTSKRRSIARILYTLFGLSAFGARKSGARETRDPPRSAERLRMDSGVFRRDDHEEERLIMNLAATRLRREGGATMPKLLWLVVPYCIGLAIGSAAAAQDQPVITFNQYQYNKFSSEYRLEVREDGSVTYNGIRNVKQTGVHKFKVSPRTVAATVKRLNDLRGEGLVPVDRIKTGTASKMSELSVKSSDTTWNVSFTADSAPTNYAALPRELEKAFPTSKYRCPYYVGSEDPSRPAKDMPASHSIEVCKFMGQK